MYTTTTAVTTTAIVLNTTMQYLNTTITQYLTTDNRDREDNWRIATISLGVTTALLATTAVSYGVFKLLRHKINLHQILNTAVDTPSNSIEMKEINQDYVFVENKVANAERHIELEKNLQSFLHAHTILINSKSFLDASTDLKYFAQSLRNVIPSLTPDQFKALKESLSTSVKNRLINGVLRGTYRTDYTAKQKQSGLEYLDALKNTLKVSGVSLLKADVIDIIDYNMQILQDKRVIQQIAQTTTVVNQVYNRLTGGHCDTCDLLKYTNISLKEENLVLKRQAEILLLDATSWEEKATHLSEVVSRKDNENITLQVRDIGVAVNNVERWKAAMRDDYLKCVKGLNNVRTLSESLAIAVNLKLQYDRIENQEDRRIFIDDLKHRVYNTIRDNNGKKTGLYGAYNAFNEYLSKAKGGTFAIRAKYTDIENARNTIREGAYLLRALVSIKTLFPKIDLGNNIEGVFSILDDRVFELKKQIILLDEKYTLIDGTFHNEVASIFNAIRKIEQVESYEVQNIEAIEYEEISRN